ncbi:helix-turn-helix transcriptional regulator [Cohnella cellulosilytica]|uniref:AraC family transcriptional regulator n=1 Tax=Cohnella cellulosilytica TaxID=986710 RepID=A0ABW2FHR6_9BACL
MGQSIVIRTPSLSGGAIFRTPPGERFYFPLHQHENSSEMLLIVGGEGEFRVDGKVYAAKEGCLLVYNRGVWHEERSIGDGFKAVYAGYSGLQIRGLPPDYLTGTEQPACVELKEHFLPIRQLFYETVTEWNSPLPESDTVANGLLGALIGRVARLLHYSEEAKVRRRPGKEAVHQARRYLEENYPSDISLAILAKLTHMNAYHLIHLFKGETGMSPIQYLIRYRMEVAKQYLATTELPMVDIADKVGYKSETYFQNLFKKTTGVSPGKYRLSCREEPGS